MNGIIKRPLVTEKNTQHGESGVYVFEVTREANKKEIQRVIEKMFKVKVKSVKTMNCRTKVKNIRFGVSKKQYWKKALVRLAPGDKIGLFEGA